ncbi:MAG: trypsin-like peptidase domain-containing protein [Gemmatimonadetes bacterium]|nr:trypsin-like peptidase domain-containing protein [Gemmatimonadota bacterium]
MVDPLRTKAKVIFFVALAFVFGVGLASSLQWTAGSYAGPALLQSGSAAPKVSEDVIAPALALNRAFEAIADAVTPSVVRIESERALNATATRRTVPNIPEEFRRFFDFPLPDDQTPVPQLAGGTGFIVSEDGYVLTNNHVVSGAEKIRVWLQDGRFFNARIIGTDPTTDVAVIKVDATSLPAVAFGDSDAARIGEWVVAIGNPGIGGSRLDYTVTAGIVSAKGRSLGIIGRELQQNQDMNEMAGYGIENFIQTDAAINPGNSGGPLVNLRGQVIGINTAIASRTGYYEGYGFAIPVNLARRVTSDLIEYGRVRRAWLGVRITPVSPEDAEVYNLPRVAGALINDFSGEESPARRAGIQPGDVVVSVNGEPVEHSGELQQRIASHRPGETVTLRVYRARQPRDIPVRLGEAPFSAETPTTAEAPAPPEEKLGINVEDLTPETARRLGFRRPGGAVIVGVSPYSPAARYGLGAGPLRIVEINGRAMSNAADVKSALESVGPGDIVSLVVETPDGTSRIVNMRIPA